MADRADAADARGQPGHFPEWPAEAETLEAAKIGDVEARVDDLVVVIQRDGDLRMSFDARDGVMRNACARSLTGRSCPLSTVRIRRRCGSAIALKASEVVAARGMPALYAHMG